MEKEINCLAENLIVEHIYDHLLYMNPFFVKEKKINLLAES